MIVGLKDANTDQVIKQVREKLAQIQKTLPPGSQLNVFYDRANLIGTAIGTISDALFEAVVLVILLLALFLGNLRAALVVSLSLPLAALATFMLMRYFNLSANLMSSAAGDRHRYVGGLLRGGGGEHGQPDCRRQTPAQATPHLPRHQGCGRACGVRHLIVIIVFSPLLTLSGLEGKLFTPVAITIVFAMLSALALSLTVIPVLASYLVNEKAANEPRPLAGSRRATCSVCSGCYSTVRLFAPRHWWHWY